MKSHPSILLSSCLFLLIQAHAALASTTPPTTPSPFVRDGASPRSSHASFSARYRHHHEPSQTLLDEARVLSSDNGVRVEQVMGDSGNVFIVNFAQDKFWFIDRQRQLFHVVPVAMTDEDFTRTAHPLITNSAGFLQFSACSGLDAMQGETDSWQGRIVQRWSCWYEDELVEEQWYSTSLGVVLRSSTRDGYVSELTDVRERMTSVQNFEPPSDYRSVSIEELMNPAMPISAYIE